ncbi:hypothetical protein FRC09_001648 [Ceratobasidium sp. 395]|nr:hypothetical protein FRC09_001648 [Ceratobasidium sp. 395]
MAEVIVSRRARATAYNTVQIMSTSNGDAEHKGGIEVGSGVGVEVEGEIEVEGESESGSESESESGSGSDSDSSNEEDKWEGSWEQSGAGMEGGSPVNTSHPNTPPDTPDADAAMHAANAPREPPRLKKQTDEYNKTIWVEEYPNPLAGEEL